MMSEMGIYNLHAVRHHQPSGCRRESSGLSEYHQRKHFEGCSHRSHCLIAFLFSSAATIIKWPGLGMAIDMQA